MMPKKQPEEAFFKEQGYYAQGKVEEIRAAADHQKSKILWETVNKLTGRKETNKGRIKVKSLDEGIKKWKNHFVNLLRKPPVIRPNEKQLYYSTHCQLTRTISPWKS